MRCRPCLLHILEGVRDGRLGVRLDGNPHQGAAAFSQEGIVLVHLPYVCKLVHETVVLLEESRDFSDLNPNFHGHAPAPFEKVDHVLPRDNLGLFIPENGGCFLEPSRGNVGHLLQSLCHCSVFAADKHVSGGYERREGLQVKFLH